MAKGRAQEFPKVDEGYADFIGRYPGYVKTALLDTLRATETVVIAGLLVFQHYFRFFQ